MDALIDHMRRINSKLVAVHPRIHRYTHVSDVCPPFALVKGHPYATTLSCLHSYTLQARDIGAMRHFYDIGSMMLDKGVNGIMPLEHKVILRVV